MSEQSREAAIRLVVAVQWGEAIALLDPTYVAVDGSRFVRFGDGRPTRCAVDVVDAFWPRTTQPQGEVSER